LPDRQLVRFVLGPDNQIVPDVASKLPGRGAWVRASREAVETAVRKNAFARAFKTGLKAPEGLADLTETLLARRVLELLGLARRAGALALGKDLVDSAIRSKRQIAIIEASDGAADGREKLQGLYLGRWGVPAPTVGCFSQTELGMALGRAHVIHACFVQERLALAWAAEIDRLAGFRAIVPASWPTSWPYNAVGLGVAGDEPLGSASAANEPDFDPET
jgi:predicted RNA-binding protein YlxR (DUF448 family)